MTSLKMMSLEMTSLENLLLTTVVQFPFSHNFPELIEIESKNPKAITPEAFNGELENVDVH